MSEQKAFDGYFETQKEKFEEFSLRYVMFLYTN